MIKFFGRYDVIVDDKKRLTLPAQLRKKIDETTLYLTQSLDGDCLWLFSPEKWDELIRDKVEKNTDLFSYEDRSLMRRLIGHSYEVEIDKAGRILIDKTLCELSGISKNCWVIGQLDYIEIWDAERYMQYEESSKSREDVAITSRNISNRIKREKGLD